MVIKSAILLFVLSLINKGFGFIKSVTLASVFGTSFQTDAYYVAEGLMLNVLIPVSEAVAVSFLPVYIGIKEKNNNDSKVYAKAPHIWNCKEKVDDAVVYKYVKTFALLDTELSNNLEKQINSIITKLTTSLLPLNINGLVTIFSKSAPALNATIPSLRIV